MLNLTSRQKSPAGEIQSRRSCSIKDVTGSETQRQFVARVRPSTGSGPSEPDYLAAYSTPEDSGVKWKKRQQASPSGSQMANCRSQNKKQERSQRQEAREKDEGGKREWDKSCDGSELPLVTHPLIINCGAKDPPF